MQSDFNIRETWGNLRYSYYSAGRSEILLNNYQAGEMLLGYAVETSLKHLLIENGYNKQAILNSHNIISIYNECQNLGFLANTNVSLDFLNYINDHFLGRYPSLLRKALENTFEQGVAMFQSPQILSWYDDVIYQIDCEILSINKDASVSSFIKAGFDSDSLRGRLFHHGNFHACMILNNTIDSLKKISPHVPEIPRLERGIQYYWSVPANFIDKPLIIQPQAFDSVSVKIGFSKDFKGPRFSDKETISFTFAMQNQLMIGHLPWSQ